MITSVPIDRLLTMSAFTPLIELRRYLLTNTEVSPVDAASSLRTISTSFAASDHEAAIELHQILHPYLTFDNFASDLRTALSYLVVQVRPPWARRVSLGRAIFLSGLGESVNQCFENAKLLDGDDKETVGWWDQLSHQLREVQNFANLAQGREAERRSLEHERQKLRTMGIALEPKWSALDDNTLGYDILSYRPGHEPDYHSNVLIEVKSSSRNPPIAYISRNEWQKAAQSPKNYIFHLWDIHGNNLVECTATDIEPHIPTDKGVGEWTNVCIPIRVLR